MNAAHTHIYPFGQLVRGSYIHVFTPRCLSRLFVSPVCQLRSWGEMRNEVSKSRQYGFRRPPLGGNEEDWTVCTLCVFASTWVEESNKKTGWWGQRERVCVCLPLLTFALELVLMMYVSCEAFTVCLCMRERRFLDWLTFHGFSLCLVNIFHTLSYRS